MSGQLAKLFIRGSLVNTTAKNLTKEQQKEVSNLMELVWNDKYLDTAKYKFCSVLGSTIGNEYKNKEYALNEIWITIWRTAVDVLYHHPRPDVINNEKARRKYFKQCIYMYMKQILNENKIPSFKNERTIDGQPYYVTKEIIKFLLDNNPKNTPFSIEESEETTKFSINCDELPNNILSKIEKLKTEVRNLGVLIILSNNSITLVQTSHNPTYFKKQISIKSRINFHSMSGIQSQDEKDNFHQYCEFKAMKKGEQELDTILVQDSIQTLLSRLPNKARQVCNILINTPNDFLDQFYPNRKKEVRPKAAHIAKYLGLSKSEVTKAIDLIRKQAIALDIT